MSLGEARLLLRRSDDIRLVADYANSLVEGRLLLRRSDDTAGVAGKLLLRRSDVRGEANRREPEP